MGFELKHDPWATKKRYPNRSLRRLAVLAIVGVLVLYHFFSSRLHIPAPFLTQLQPSQQPSQQHTYPDEFPKNIWQARLGDAIDPAQWANKSRTWKENNPDWEYHLLTDETATAFVHENFAHRPAVIDFWTRLGPIIARADFIRYLALLAQGGIYGDIDTSNLKPMADWIPASLRSKPINAIVGIEYDDTTYPLFVRPLCFSQWTIMAKAGHPLFETAVRRLMSNMDYLARLQRKELKDITPNKQEVLQGTGPGMFTDTVMEVLRDQTGEQLSWETFHDQRTPTLYGDVLVLPINGFGSGQKHSKSSRKEYGEAFVKHHFGKTWYTKPASAPAKPKAEHEDVATKEAMGLKK